jgi:hypothetical protein
MSNSKEELKPCPLPLCGGKASYVNFCKMAEVAIRCEACGIETPDGTAEFVTKLWNTRSPDVTEAIDRLDKIERIMRLSLRQTNVQACKALIRPYIADFDVIKKLLEVKGE